MDDLVLWIVVATALAFDFTNGFHDTANAVATSISTRAMTPRTAVVARPSVDMLVRLRPMNDESRVAPNEIAVCSF